jgi:hypothetical protein
MIEPNSSLFYSIVAEVFGTKAGLATRTVSKIEIVEKDHPHCQTLCIDKNGLILINKDFWRKHVKNREDAKIVLLHEMFHSVLGDHIRLGQELGDPEKMSSEEKAKAIQEKNIMGISMDMRINAAIYQYFVGVKYGNTSVLQNLYPKNGVQGLLRPGSAYGRRNKYYLLYQSLYNTYMNRLTEDEKAYAKEMFQNEETLRRALKLLLPKKPLQTMKIVLLGYHGGGEEKDKDDSGGKAMAGEKPDQESDDSPEEAPPEIEEGLKEAIRDALIDKLEENGGGKGAGFGSVLSKSLVKVIKSNKTLNTKVLDRFICSHKVNELRCMYKKPRRISSVVPIKPSKTEIAMLAAGYIPTLWKNDTVTIGKQNKNIAIYLDVSGSTKPYLPEILSVINNLRQQINTIYCFSNELYEHSTKDLVKGEYQSTGGTDFDCVIEHAIENKVDKCIVFTDGQANLRKFTKKQALEQIKDAAIIYFGDWQNKNNFFEKNYDKSYQLKDLV